VKSTTELERADRAGLEGRVALVTGGARGLGAEIAASLAEAGATVVVGDLDLDRAKAVAEGLPDGQAVALDVRDPEAAERVVHEALARHGALDAVVNNAGVDVTAPFEEIPADEWERVIEVNLLGPVRMSRAAFPVMRAAGGGHIVNIVSTAAKRAWANASAYHASKWGLLGFSHGLHVEGRAAGIGVTAVIAGGMRTPFILDRFPDTPLDVLQEPRNVADVVRFVLLQPEGTVIPEVMVLPVRETSWP
jgi:NAD(P)-dependent dehydrogenase (short-subunit alcohol dehydrogenase family)